jgi:hypothetical protein
VQAGKSPQLMRGPSGGHPTLDSHMILPLTGGAKLVRLLPLGVFAVTSLTCSDSPSEPRFEPCPGDAVTIEASTGLTPLFTWTPACGIAFLEVYPAPGGGALWTVYAESGAGPENPIPSGVRYGTTPLRGHTVAGPQPLQAGHSYSVRVSRLLCDQGVLCTLQHAGDVSFQP